MNQQWGNIVRVDLGGRAKQQFIGGGVSHGSAAPDRNVGALSVKNVPLFLIHLYFPQEMLFCMLPGLKPGVAKDVRGAIPCGFLSVGQQRLEAHLFGIMAECSRKSESYGFVGLFPARRIAAVGRNVDVGVSEVIVLPGNRTLWVTRLWTVAPNAVGVTIPIRSLAGLAQPSGVFTRLTAGSAARRLVAGAAPRRSGAWRRCRGGGFTT